MVHVDILQPRAPVFSTQESCWTKGCLDQLLLLHSKSSTTRFGRAQGPTHACMFSVGVCRQSSVKRMRFVFPGSGMADGPLQQVRFHFLDPLLNLSPVERFKGEAVPGPATGGSINYQGHLFSTKKGTSRKGVPYFEADWGRLPKSSSSAVSGPVGAQDFAGTPHQRARHLQGRRLCH